MGAPQRSDHGRETLRAGSGASLRACRPGHVSGPDAWQGRKRPRDPAPSGNVANQHILSAPLSKRVNFSVDGSSSMWVLPLVGYTGVLLGFVFLTLSIGEFPDFGAL